MGSSMDWHFQISGKEDPIDLILNLIDLFKGIYTINEVVFEPIEGKRIPMTTFKKSYLEKVRPLIKKGFFSIDLIGNLDGVNPTRNPLTMDIYLLDVSSRDYILHLRLNVEKYKDYFGTRTLRNKFNQLLKRMSSIKNSYSDFKGDSNYPEITKEGFRI